MKKIFKNKIVWGVLLLVMAVIGYGVIANNTVPSTVTTKDSEKLSEYIEGTSVSIIKFTDNTVGYCFDMNKKIPNNMELTLRGEAPAGLAYIVRHGGVTSDYRKNYYITQTAIWWFLDDINGTNYLGDDFKNGASDPEGLRPIIKQLVNGAKSASYVEPSVGFENSNVTFTLDPVTNEFVSSSIKVKGVNLVEKITINLGANASGAKIVNMSGNPQTSFGNGESFVIRVPKNLVNDNNFSFNISASTVGSIYKLYLYSNGDGEYQRVLQVLPNVTNKPLSATLNLNIVTSELKIIKKDKKTNEVLSGAKFALLDMNNNVLYTWISNNTYQSIKGLVPGTYKLKEISAPAGYVMIEQFMTIELTANEVKEIIVYNKKADQPTVTELRIIKKDAETMVNLPGATLGLKNENGDIIEEWLTTGEAKIFKNLPAGKYYLYEKNAPSGYVLNNELKEIELINNQVVTVEFLNNKEENPEEPAYDITVRVNKLNVETNGTVAGAKLAIKNIYGEVVDTFISTNEGYITTKLVPGVYTLVELEAPNGYALYQGVVEFQVFNTEGVQDINFYNSPYYEVPNTNNNLNKNKIIIGLGIVLIGGILIVVNLKKKNEKKN